VIFQAWRWRVRNCAGLLRRQSQRLHEGAHGVLEVQVLGKRAPLWLVAPVAAIPKELSHTILSIRTRLVVTCRGHLRIHPAVVPPPPPTTPRHHPTLPARGATMELWFQSEKPRDKRRRDFVRLESVVRSRRYIIAPKAKVY
jgi:hypothetical protein